MNKLYTFLKVRNSCRHFEKLSKKSIAPLLFRKQIQFCRHSLEMWKLYILQMFENCRRTFVNFADCMFWAQPFLISVQMFTLYNTHFFISLFNISTNCYFLLNTVIAIAWSTFLMTCTSTYSFSFVNCCIFYYHFIILGDSRILNTTSFVSQKNKTKNDNTHTQHSQIYKR